MKALLTQKIGMTSLIGEDGTAMAVTLLRTTANTVTQIKTAETDGYNAVQLGVGKAKRAGKAAAGHLKKAKANSRLVRERRVSELPALTVGDQLDASIFEVGDQVDASGISKGKGFAGTIKRHNFHRGRKTHGGQSYRRPGSIGSMYPQRIFPGKKMAGRMGHQQVTVKRLKIALVDAERGIIGVRGAVPGPRKALIAIREAK